MKNTRTFKIVVVSFCLFVLVSCSFETKKPASKIIIGQESVPERLNPISMKDPHTLRIAWQIFEGLVGLDEENKVVPRIAESWETKDNRTWTFHIRKGASFHTSRMFGASPKDREVTAHDVLYSYTRFCSPKSYSSFVLADSIKGCGDHNAGKADSVAGLKVIDDYTFQVELNKPEPFFINRITSPWISIFPKESEQDGFADSWGLDLIVGTGPYKFVSKTDNEVILESNDKYWDKTRIPKIKRVIYRIVNNDQIRFNELVANKIDLMVLPNKLFPLVFEENGAIKEKYKSAFNIQKFETFNHHLIGVNSVQVPDLHLRRAMYYGIDREELINKMLYGNGVALGGAVPPKMSTYKTLIKDFYDPERASEELRLSEYDGSEIELLVHGLAGSEQIGQIFQHQMAKLGIKIKLVSMDFNSIIGRMVKGETQLFSMFAEIVFSSPEPLLINLFSTEKIPVPNFWKYSNASVDKKFKNLASLPDSVQSIKAAAEIEKEIMADVPAIFLYSQNNLVIFSKKVGNLKINGHNHYFIEELETLL